MTKVTKGAKRAWQSDWQRAADDQAELREALERIVGHVDNGPANPAWIRSIASGALERVYGSAGAAND